MERVGFCQVRKEVNAVKEQLTTKVDGVKKVADDITTKVESVAAKVHELVPHQ